MNRSIEDNAATLLHELGHVYNDLWGPGKSDIRQDVDENGQPAFETDGRTPISVTNTNDVKKNCNLQ